MAREPERNLSAEAKELVAIFRESNVYERGPMLAALEDKLDAAGRSPETLFEEIVRQPTKPGWDTRKLYIATDDIKQVNIHVPESYDPAKPTPVVMCYHWSGGDGFGMVSEVRRHLAGIVDDFILVGPDNIGPYNIDSQRSWKAETRTILREIRGRYNVDSDRIYAVGFSLGGYAVWSNAAYFSDEFAAAISMGASFDVAPEIPGLWEALIPNTKETPVLYAWGDEDTLQMFGIDLKTPVGSIGKFNPKVTTLTKELGLPHEAAFLKGVGHVFAPPTDRSRDFLSRRRAEIPKEIHRSFRTINQGRAWWFEALIGEGPQWHYRGVPIEYQPPETKEQAIGRVLTGLLGRADGKREGNKITLTTKGVGDAVLWFSEDMIDWTQPVVVNWNGKEVWNERLEKSTGVCLLQYVRNRDRQRLWWAGIRLSTKRDAQAVTAKEDIANVVAPQPFAFT